MLDPVAMKNTALAACLKPLGDFLEAHGLDRPLAQYSRNEILSLVDTVVIAYQDNMLIQYENAVVQEKLARKVKRGKRTSS